MANEKFYLHFQSDNYGTKSIDEPVGFDTCDFNLKQEDMRYARDISFAGGMAELTFYDRREHELETLLYYHSTFGFESKVSLIIDFEEETENVVGELDFKEAETDGLTYFKCKIIQDSKQATLKRRKEIKVNLLSDKDLDGNDIDPLIPENILLKAKPLVQISEWSVPALEGGVFCSTNGGNFNAINQVLNYGIEDTLSYIQDGTESKDIVYLRAKNALKDLKVDITNLEFSGGNVINVDFNYKVGYLEDFDSLPDNIVYSGIVINPVPGPAIDFSFTIPYIAPGQVLWMYFRSSSGFFAVFKSGTIKISADSEAYNTITPAFRLYDVMKYVTKSISGMDITAPSFQPGSFLYNQFLFNGNFLRNITDKGFFISLKDLEDSLVEFNSDYEIQPDNVVFFGMYNEFYKTNEIAFFDTTQFENMTLSFNPRYTINQFLYKWNNYQSQKENTLDNTYDSVHGETQWLFKNKNVENKKDVQIDWIRDAFMIEENRRKALTDSNDKATQDDDKLFIIDGIETEEQELTEVSKLFHQYDSTNNLLMLNNARVFNWRAFGITIGDTFNIISGANVGQHIVTNVTNQILELQRVSPGTSDVQGEYVTLFSCVLNDVNFTNWTGEDFTVIDNINNGFNYANLKFSAKRNILRYWNEYLATANIYHLLEQLKNTFYKNNPDAITVYLGDTVREGDDFIPTGAIITPVIYKDVIFICEYEDFVALENSIRTERGYIRFIDNNEIVKKGFIKEMSYSNLEKRLICQIEEKYEPSSMTITTPSDGIILINNETRLHKLKYKFSNNKLYIYDINEELMYNGVYWGKVSVNEAIPTTLNELKTWLNLL